MSSVMVASEAELASVSGAFGGGVEARASDFYGGISVMSNGKAAGAGGPCAIVRPAFLVGEGESEIPGFGVCERAGERFLTIDGRVAFYPQDIVPEKEAALIGELDTISAKSKAERVMRRAGSRAPATQNAAPGTQVRYFRAADTTMGQVVAAAARSDLHLHGGRLYAHVPGAGRMLGTWHVCDPIEVCRADDGKEIAKTAMVSGPAFRQLDKVEKFLNDEFLEDIKACSEKLNVSAHEFESGKKIDAVGKKLCALMVGDRVKIKCEGRVGVVVGVAADGETATLRVDGSKAALKYLVEDLVSMGSGNGARVDRDAEIER